MQESSSIKHKHSYDHNLEQQKKSWAIIILSSSFIIFLLTFIGFIDAFSEWIADSLFENLGYTNKWVKTYGPDWFLHINSNFSGLGSAPIILCFLIIVAGYYKIKKQRKRLNKFLSIIIGGGIFLQILKIIFADELPYEPIKIFITTISTYPSGHTMMATIFYLTLAVFITRWQSKKKVKRFTVIVALSLVFLVAASMILSGAHTFTEVLAGWAAGMVWLSCCWMLERYIKKNRSMV